MKQRICIIDPFVKEPAANCFNHLVEEFHLNATYHPVSVLGSESLKSIQTPKAIIILGSSTHVSEKLDWQKHLFETIDEFANKNIPILGICYGHQVLASMYGSKVGFIKKDETKYHNTRTITLTDDFLGLKTGEKFNLAFSHRQRVNELGEDLISLAESGLGKNEIITHKKLPLHGIQAHPEASNYFCKVESGLKDEKEILNAQRDGNRIINAFLNYYE
jgi:GMP synthase (glutamine-hydrolysing)